MNGYKRLTTVSVIALLIFASLASAQNADKFIGRWALTLPNGGAGWLGIEQKDGYLAASILWGGGSVVPVSSVYLDGDSINVTRVREVKRKDSGGIFSQMFTETISATVAGDDMKLVQINPADNGDSVMRKEFNGKRIPPLPAKPDLSKVKYGKPITLFNGKDLTGWKLTNPADKNGWSVKDDVLINRVVQPQGGHLRYGNLRTVDEFEDFNIKLEVKVPKDGNSGVYLRGIYEVQVSDSYGKEPGIHDMGAIYSRIAPSQAAVKEPGVWQQMDITLLKRHVTIILNGKTIIDNQPLLGCTGGAMWSDESRPGPILLQGDHKDVDYRNIILTPIE
jgi:hypothetical protein